MHMAQILQVCVLNQLQPLLTESLLLLSMATGCMPRCTPPLVKDAYVYSSGMQNILGGTGTLTSLPVVVATHFSKRSSTTSSARDLVSSVTS